jgi:hypothetical protein
MHPKLRQDFPALRSLEATPNNLLQQATTFVGRQRELAELREALCATHLLTLVGAGGIGKTRLSLQVAADVLDDYPDGVWFVELAPLNDERLVPQAVASVLGVKEEAGRPVTEALVRHVADRRLLLVLDNCEHLVQACAALAEQLLKSGPPNCEFWPPAVSLYACLARQASQCRRSRYQRRRNRSPSKLCAVSCCPSFRRPCSRGTAHVRGD